MKRKSSAWVDFRSGHGPYAGTMKRDSVPVAAGRRTIRNFYTHRAASSRTRGVFMLTANAGAFHPRDAGPIRCVIADDHEMLRYGVRRLLEDDPDFAVVGEAGDAAEALKLALEH